MRLNIAAKRGTNAAQELNKVDSDNSSNHVNESSAEILGLTEIITEGTKPIPMRYLSVMIIRHYSEDAVWRW